MKKIKKISGVPSYTEAQIVKLSKLHSVIQKSFSNAGFVRYSPAPLESRELILSKGGIENQIFSVSRVMAGESDLITKFALPFDRTVPLALFVARNEREIVYPIKRYDISHSFRGERPQKGRFSVFIQADIDVIGSDEIGLQADIETFFTIFKTLEKIEVGSFEMHINNIKLITKIVNYFDIPTKLHASVLRVTDKLSKISKQEAIFEFKKILPKYSDTVLEKVIEIFSYTGCTSGFIYKFPKLANIVENELSDIKLAIDAINILSNSKSKAIFSPMIARGLNYYSGLVFETFLIKAPKLGSIASGGRYDDLASAFTKNKHPGVGGSIGLSRLFDFLISDNQIGSSLSRSQVLIAFNENVPIALLLEASSILKQNNIITDLYSGNSILKKQLAYCNKKAIPYCLIFFNDKDIVVKNMMTGEQNSYGDKYDAIDFLNQEINYQSGEKHVHH